MKWHMNDLLTPNPNWFCWEKSSSPSCNVLLLSYIFFPDVINWHYEGRFKYWKQQKVCLLHLLAELSHIWYDVTIWHESKDFTIEESSFWLKIPHLFNLFVFRLYLYRQSLETSVSFSREAFFIKHQTFTIKENNWHLRAEIDIVILCAEIECFRKNHIHFAFQELINDLN